MSDIDRRFPVEAWLRGWCRHDVAPEVGRCAVALEEQALRAGLRLFVQSDFALYNTVMRANKDRRGYLNPIFDEVPAGCGYWIAGLDGNEAIATVQAFRLYRWHGTNLLRELTSLHLHYPHQGLEAGPGESIEMGGLVAETITGKVAFTGGIWIRQDMTGPRAEIEGAKLSGILARLNRYLAYCRWDIDFAFSSVTNALYEKGVAESYGHAHAEPGMKFALRFLGEGGAVLLWSSRQDVISNATHQLVASPP